MTLYEFKYNDYQNKITISLIEVRETAKCYIPLEPRDVAGYKEKVLKSDEEKLITFGSTSFFYSLTDCRKLFISELERKYQRKIDSLLDEIKRLTAQKEKIILAEIVNTAQEITVESN